MANNFKVDTNDVLGLNFQEYVSNVRCLALASPAQYFELRRDVLRVVKRDAISALYETFYCVLSKGTDKNGNAIGKLGTANYQPGYPSQKINNFSLEVSKVLADYIDTCIDIILPDDFEKISESKLSLKGRANVIE